MASPIGEEFILVKPSLAGFRAELTAQLSAALSGIQPQLAAAQNRLRTGAAGTVTAAGLPAVTAATANLGKTTTATTAAVTKLSSTNKAAADEFKNLGRNVKQAETAAGRYTRGVVAATAASTGFFRAVSFASGAFLVGAAVGATIGAAVNEFKQMTIVGAQTAAILKATGGAANVTAAQVDALAKTQLRLTGTDDELVKSAANVLLTFRSIRNEVGAGNDIFTRSVKAVQDISSVFGTALTGSAVQLGKALQDPIRGVTALRRSGITLSQSQRDLIKALVESGRILTAQKIILGEVEKQVGGTAAAIGKTLPGQLSILREEAKNSLGEFVKRISESRDAAKTFKDVTGGFGDAFKIAAPAIKAVAGAIALTVKGLQDLGILRPLVKTVAGLALAFGTLKLALGAVSASQALYTRIVIGATAATAAETEASTAASVANLRLATTTATSTAAAATGVATTTARVGALGIASRALGGPLGIATIALTGFAFALVKMREAAKSAPGTLKALQNALAPFQRNVGRVGDLRSQLAAASENVSLARFDVQATGRTTTRARTAAETAQPGSVAAQFRADQLSVAITKQRQAQDALTAALEKQARLQRQLTAAQAAQPFVIDNTTKKIKEQIEATLKDHDALVTLFGKPIVLNPFSVARPAAGGLTALTKELNTLRDSGNKVKHDVAVPLLGIIDTLGRIPKPKEINLVFKLVGLGANTKTILSRLGVLGRVEPGAPLGPIGPVGPVKVTATENANLREQFLALTAVIKKDREKLKTLNEIAKKRNDELATIKATVAADKVTVRNAQDSLTTARESVTSAFRSYGDAVVTLRDTLIQASKAITDAITAARQSVTASTQDAKSNLESLGQTLGGIIKDVGGSTGKLGPEFQRLRDQILAGGSDAETQRIAQQIAFRNQANPNFDVQKNFSNIVDKFLHQKITFPEFQKEIRGLVKGLTPAEVSRVLGTAVGSNFKDALAAFFKQARAIPLTGPGSREGGATAFNIVRPLNAVAAGAKAIAAARTQATKDIGSAVRAVGDAVTGIKHAQHDVIRAEQDLTRAIQKLHHDQVKETKANTLAQRANTKALNKHSALLVALAKRDKTQQPKVKPTGAAAYDSGVVTTHQAVSP